MAQSNLNGKLDKLSKQQDRRMRHGLHIKVVIMDGGELPMFVIDALLLRTIPSVKYNFNVVQFFQSLTILDLNYARISRRVRNFVNLSHQQKKMQKV